MDRDELRGKLEALAAELILDPEGMGKVASSWAAGFHNYSLGNTLLIYFQRPSSSICAGFNKWKQEGRHVKAGEKGLAILAPMIAGGSRRRDVAVGSMFNDQGDGLEVGDRPAPSQGRRSGQLLGFRTVYVFDISQTEGPDLDIGANKVSGHSAITLETAAAAFPQYPLEVVEHIADGRTDGRRIMVSRRANKAQEIVAYFHELGHVLLEHVGPEAKRRDLPHEVHELEAEAVAYLCAAGLGLESQSSVDYIKGWGGDRSKLEASGVKVLSVAEKILRLVGVIQEVEAAGAGAPVAAVEAVAI